MRVVDADPCATDRDDFRMRLNVNQFDHKQTRLPTEVAVRLDERASSGSVPNPSEALAGKHQVYADEPHNLDALNYDHLLYVTQFHDRCQVLAPRAATPLPRVGRPLPT